ncbi:MAG: hypothetical protein IPJ71_18180 [Bdellovibrionales bacterium]|nr:hypothetical protein [Bdellovibrionales bacterium]
MVSKLILFLSLILVFGAAAGAVELKELNVGDRGTLTGSIENAEVTCIDNQTRDLSSVSATLAPMNSVGLDVIGVDELTVASVYWPRGNLSDIFAKYTVTFKSDGLDLGMGAICAIKVTKPEIGFRIRVRSSK